MRKKGGAVVPKKPGEAWMGKKRKRREAQYNQARPKRHAFYASTQWRKLRKLYRSAHPLCEECERNGIVRLAEMVDHIVPIANGGAALDERNLQSLCRACHNKKHS